MVPLNKNISSYAFIILVAVNLFLLSIIAIMPPSFYIVASLLAVIVLALDVLAFSTRFYSYMLMPLLRMKKRTVVLSNDDPFYITSAGNAIVVRDGDIIHATSFVKIPIYRSATEMTDEEKLAFSRLFARVVTLSKTSFRLVSQLHVIDKDEYIKKITEKLNDAEDRYNTLINNKNTPRNVSERVSGEVTMWHNLFDSVSKSHSQAQITYAAISAVGGNEEEAVAIAAQQAEEMAAGINTVLGITATVARGQEMLVFIEPDYMIPPTTVSEMMRKDQARAL